MNNQVEFPNMWLGKFPRIVMGWSTEIFKENPYDTPKDIGITLKVVILYQIV